MREPITQRPLSLEQLAEIDELAQATANACVAHAKKFDAEIADATDTEIQHSESTESIYELLGQHLKAWISMFLTAPPHPKNFTTDDFFAVFKMDYLKIVSDTQRDQKKSVTLSWLLMQSELLRGSSGNLRVLESQLIAKMMKRNYKGLVQFRANAVPRIPLEHPQTGIQFNSFNSLGTLQSRDGQIFHVSRILTASQMDHIGNIMNLCLSFSNAGTNTWENNFLKITNGDSAVFIIFDNSAGSNISMATPICAIEIDVSKRIVTQIRRAGNATLAQNDPTSRTLITEFFKRLPSLPDTYLINPDTGEAPIGYLRVTELPSNDVPLRHGECMLFNGDIVPISALNLRSIVIPDPETDEEIITILAAKIDPTRVIPGVTEAEAIEIYSALLSVNPNIAPSSTYNRAFVRAAALQLHKFTEPEDVYSPHDPIAIHNTINQFLRIPPHERAQESEPESFAIATIRADLEIKEIGNNTHLRTLAMNTLLHIHAGRISAPISDELLPLALTALRYSRPRDTLPYSDALYILKNIMVVKDVWNEDDEAGFSTFIESTVNKARLVPEAILLAPLVFLSTQEEIMHKGVNVTNPLYKHRKHFINRMVQLNDPEIAVMLVVAQDCAFCDDKNFMKVFSSVLRSKNPYPILTAIQNQKLAEKLTSRPISSKDARSVIQGLIDRLVVLDNTLVSSKARKILTEYTAASADEKWQKLDLTRLPEKF